MKWWKELALIVKSPGFKSHLDHSLSARFEARLLSALSNIFLINKPEEMIPAILPPSLVMRSKCETSEIKNSFINSKLLHEWKGCGYRQRAFKRGLAFTGHAIIQNATFRTISTGIWPMSQVCPAEKSKVIGYIVPERMTVQRHISQPLTFESDTSTDFGIPINVKGFKFQKYFFLKCINNCKRRIRKDVAMQVLGNSPKDLFLYNSGLDIPICVSVQQ